MIGNQPRQKVIYLENDLMILAEMWRKKIEAMKESESTRTMNGSLLGYVSSGSN
jgi:hypothetical protein